MGNFNGDLMEYPIIANQIPVRTRHPLIREKLLWSHVLREALQCYQGKAIVVSSAVDRVQDRELERLRARRWFRSDDTDPGSFLFVCKVLSLDPEYIRAGLKHMPLITLHRKEYGKKLRRRAAVNG